MSLRESPIRHRRQARPPWLVALLIVVGVLVVLGLGYGIWSLVRGPADEPATEQATASASACPSPTAAAAAALPEPSDTKVNVYNATATSGLARTTAKQLEKREFVIVDVANDPAGKEIAGVGEIRYGKKGAARAQLLLAYVPGATLVELDRKGRVIDLAVGTGFTTLAPQAEVDAILAVPSPVASGTGCPS